MSLAGFFSLGDIKRTPVKSKFTASNLKPIFAPKSHINIYTLKLVSIDLPKNIIQLTLGFHNLQKSIKKTNELITSSNYQH